MLETICIVDYHDILRLLDYGQPTTIEYTFFGHRTHWRLVDEGDVGQQWLTHTANSWKMKICSIAEKLTLRS
jgi:hypothetical protein